MTERYQAVSQMEGLEIRYAEADDAVQLDAWISDPQTNSDFPMSEPAEITEAAKRWVDFYKQQACLTAVYQGRVAGISILFLQTYERIKHQCMHILVVAPQFRCKGIGSALLDETIHLAKTKHQIELLHVEVYGNLGVERFYKRRGFEEFARQERWTKEANETYRSRICLERFI